MDFDPAQSELELRLVFKMGKITSYPIWSVTKLSCLLSTKIYLQ